MINSYKIWTNILEFLFPSEKIEREVREMELSDYIALETSAIDRKSNVLFFFKYKNPIVREAIKQFKYGRNHKISRIFAEIIYSEMLEELADLSLFEDFKNPVLVPIPMSKSEKYVRGFNQIELLIENIVDLDRENFNYDFKLLKKTKNTPRQTGLNREERIHNVTGIFEVNKSAEGKNIILIDDVLTTGATINEAKKVLKNAGAKKVFSVVIAR